MDGKAQALRLVGTLAAVLAAILLVIPLANAGRRNSQPVRDGWYYTVLRWNATRSTAGDNSSCQPNRTYQQAVDAGVLPAIVSALHGGKGDPALTC